MEIRPQDERQPWADVAEAEGWDIFAVDSDGHPPFELQRCDERAAFDGDPEAWVHVWTKAHENPSGPHAAALTFLKERAPDEYQTVAAHCAA